MACCSPLVAFTITAVKLHLPFAAHDALVELACRERRDAARQAEHLVITELHRRGLVSSDGTERQSAEEAQRETAAA